MDYTGEFKPFFLKQSFLMNLIDVTILSAFFVILSPVLKPREYISSIYIS